MPVARLLLALALAALPRPAAAQPITNIYNGASARDIPAVVGVGLVNRDGSTSICSGTLITPTVVLTAAHCLAFDPVDGIAAVFADGTTRRDYPLTGFVAHPEFRFSRAALADIGVVLLATPVPDVTPLPLVDRAPRPGTVAQIVGYGDDGRGQSGRKLAGTVRIRRCPRVVRVRNGKVRLSKSLCWRFRSSGSDTCPGDSGGPLLVNGQVAGVTSGGIGVGTCPSLLSYDTNVARYRDWIDSVVRQAPAAAGIDP